MNNHWIRRHVGAFPRIPLEGNIDLTYRCNNDCVHCWLRVSPDAPETKAELSFDEIRRIVEEARAMGCRSWAISGGEPMLRPDFGDIFEFILSRSRSYALNTNGTLITPRIARMMRRPGYKMIALYGATADVHDRITRAPGSFEAFRRGVSLLKETGAGFMVQIVPLKDNFHQFGKMVELAESLSPTWKIGASWLYLSADRNPRKNREILAQRLSPAEAVSLDSGTDSTGGPDPKGADLAAACPDPGSGDGVFSTCAESRRDFHVDPYGGMSFCAFVKEPGRRIDLRKTGFREAWEQGIPESARMIAAGIGQASACGACALRAGCSWCPVYAWLEHGRYDAEIDYLCSIAEEKIRIRNSI
jgi:MoaA/NifB/PqqE/SkfB family radical SAM enzyme